MSNPADTMSIYVVDDDAAVRRALSITLGHAGYEVLTFGSAERFLEEFDPESYSCIILDIKMPGIEGLEVQQELGKIGAFQPVIFVTGHASVPLSVQAIKSGAVDFLEKPFRRKVLLERIDEARMELDALKRRNEIRGNLDRCLAQLTQREREVFLLLIGEKPRVSSKELAMALDISPRTADQHRASVLCKMEVESVAELGMMLARAEYDIASIDGP